jgi:hypothetical protein
MKNFLMLGLLAFWGTTIAHSAEEQSAFVSCMEIKVKEIFQPPDSVMPMMRLQAQITEREYEKLVGTLNKSPEDLADLEVSLEQAKSPRNPEAIMMKELTRQCAKHIKWTG